MKASAKMSGGLQGEEQLGRAPAEAGQGVLRIPAGFSDAAANVPMAAEL